MFFYHIIPPPQPHRNPKICLKTTCDALDITRTWKQTTCSTPYNKNHIENWDWKHWDWKLKVYHQQKDHLLISHFKELLILTSCCLDRVTLTSKKGQILWGPFGVPQGSYAPISNEGSRRQVKILYEPQPPRIPALRGVALLSTWLISNLLYIHTIDGQKGGQSYI